MTAQAARPMPPALGLAQPALLLAYLPLSHFAVLRGDSRLLALALAAIVLGLLLEPLWHRRAWAWSVLALALAALWHYAAAPWLELALLLMPVVFLWMFAWLFGRSLLPGRAPLIARIVAALEGGTATTLEADIARYARRLTAIWASVLGLLGLVNLALAVLATPSGVLARLGIAAPVHVTDAQWSWFANGVNYGLVGLVFVIEYAYRSHRFPGRYKSPLDFARRMAALEPAFWRDLFK